MAETIDFEKPGRAIYDLSEQGDFGSDARGPICVINNGVGPRVLVVAGVHGDEYESQLCLHALLAETRAEHVTGRLVIVPEANFPASGAGRRVSPVDGENMNRTFPGRLDGPSTERLSALVFEAAARGCDLVIDVHAGGPTYEGELIAFGFRAPDSAVSAATLSDLLDGLGVPFVTHQECVPTTLVGAAVAAGIAAVEIEGGGTTLLRGGVVDDLLRVVRNGLKRFNVLTGPAEAGGGPALHVDVGPDNMLVSEVAGLVEHRVELGQRVEVGDVLVAVRRLGALDEEPHRVRAKASGIVISQRSILTAKAGEILGNTGTPRSGGRSTS